MSDQARSASALFAPDRLTLAREAAGLTKAALGEQVEVTGPAISQFETGASRPSPATIARLAWATEVSPGFFARRERPAPLPTSEAAFFRSVRATTRLQRRQASARAALLAELASELEGAVELPPLALPAAAGFDERTPDRDVVERAAELRSVLGASSGPIRHLVRELEARGVIVATLQREDGRVSAFGQWFDGRPVLVLQAGEDDMARRRFDAAHELGHLVMHDDPDPGNAVIERQANLFAASLLMPADEIHSQLPTRYDLAQLIALKRTWGVSIQALLFRSRELGRLSPDAYRRAMIKFSATFGRQREPHPLRGSEDPVLLWRAAEVAFGAEDPLAGLAEMSQLPQARLLQMLDRPAARPKLDAPQILTSLDSRRERADI